MSRMLVVSAAVTTTLYKKIAARAVAEKKTRSTVVRTMLEAQEAATAK